MKILQSVVVLAVLLIMAAVGFQYLTSHSLDWRLGKAEEQATKTGERVDGLAQESRAHGDVLKRQDEQISTQAATLGSHTKDIAELRKRMGEAEARVEDLTRAGETDRKAAEENKAEIAKLKADLESMDRRRDEIDDLRKDLKRTQSQSDELKARLLLIEKALKMERPQP